MGDPKPPELSEESTKNPLLKRISAAFVAQIATVALNAAAFVVIARHLGPGGNGVAAIGLLIPYIGALFLSLAVPYAVVYLIGRQRDAMAEIMTTAITVTLLVGLLGSGVLWMFQETLSHLVPGVPISVVRIGIVSIPIELLVTLLIGCLQATDRLIRANVWLTLRAIMFFLLVVLFSTALVKTGVRGPLIANLISGVLVLVPLGRAAYRAGARFTIRFEKRLAWTMLSLGLRGHSGTVVSFLLYRVDVFLVNALLNRSDTGIYYVSLRMAEFLWLLPNAVAFVLLPDSASRDALSATRVATKAVKLTLAASALGAIALGLLGIPIIRLFFGDAFRGSFTPLLALLPGTVLLGGTKVLSQAISGRGKPEWNAFAAIAALVTIVIADLVLIPSYGILGAAIGSSLAYGLSFGVSILLVRQLNSRSG